MIYFKYVANKILSMFMIMLIVSFAVFYLLRLSGIDPVTVMIGEKQSTPELKEALRQQFHLNDPLFVQYEKWLLDLLQGNLGIDYVNKQDIGRLIASRIPITVGLVLMSSLIGITLAITFGVIAAVNRNKWIDQLLSILMLFLSSAPGFLVSILVIVLFSKIAPGYSFIGACDNFSEYVSRLSIPAAVMSLHMIAMLGRITRSSMINQLQSPYIATAVAKGMPKRNITFRHAFHNAVIPVLTVSGLMIAASVGGTILIEQIFSLPGIGGLLVTSVQSNNYPVVQVLVLFMLIVYMVMSLAVDVLNTVIDPRVKLR